METTAGAIMSHPAICARAEMSVADLMDLLAENRISGVPVVDAEDRLVGVISITDLLSLEADAPDEELAEGSDYHTSPAMDGLAAASGLLQPDEAVRDLAVSELMSRQVITTTEDAPLGQLADQLLTHRIHRLVVVRGEGIAGVVSVSDILHCLQSQFRSSS